jgi:uncharacterized protein YegP (UPF0339 family)
MVSVFEIFKNKKGRWEFVLRASNGKIVSCSKEYTSKKGAVAGVESVEEAVNDAIILYKYN